MQRGSWGGPPWRAGRARRGDMKYLILDVLTAGPRHGYDIIAALEERSSGRYRPSAGSVYPNLQLLEDGGYVSGEAVDGKRIYAITERGRELLATKPADAAGGDDADGGVDLQGSAMKLVAAVMQAARGTDASAQTKVRAILDGARKEVYAILAESD